MMRIGMICYGIEIEREMEQAFKELGEYVERVSLSEVVHYEWNEVSYQTLEQIERETVDVLCSACYDITVATYCDKYKIPYLSWVQENPCLEVFHKSIQSDMNYVFLSNRELYEQLNKKNVARVFYLPLAVNPTQDICINHLQESKALVTYMGDLFTSSKADYQALMDCLPDYRKGFIEGLVKVQQQVKDYNILETALRQESDFLKELVSLAPCYVQKDFLVGAEYVYANYFLYPRLNFLERVSALIAISREVPLELYTRQKGIKIGNSISHEWISSNELRKNVIRSANVNLILPSRMDGFQITKEALTILGNRGFLLTEYKKGWASQLTDGVHYVSFSSNQELKDKLEFYQSHPDIRQQVIKRGYELVCNDFDLKKRMLDMRELVHKEL